MNVQALNIATHTMAPNQQPLNNQTAVSMIQRIVQVGNEERHY